MKVYEYGEQCEHDGILWSDLVISNEQSFEVIKTALVAKFELNLLLTTEALDESYPDDTTDDAIQYYIDAHLEQKKYDMKRLSQAKQVMSMAALVRIDKVFIRQREVAEYVGCDYWSLLAAKEIEKLSN